MASRGVTCFSVVSAGWDLAIAMGVSADTASDIAAGAISGGLFETLDFD